MLIFLIFCVVLLCVFTFWVPCVCDVRNDFRIQWCSIRLYLQLFVGGLLSYLHYLCLFVYIGVQHIMCYVFVLFVFVLFILYCQFLWIVHFWLSLRYSIFLNQYMMVIILRNAYLQTRTNYDNTLLVFVCFYFFATIYNQNIYGD